MRFEGVTRVEQRLELIRAVRDGGLKVAEACRLWGVSRETFYVWLRRYESKGIDGLADRSSRPHRSPNRLDWGTESKIVEMRRAHRRWGARRIHTELARKDVTPMPSISTVHAALVRHGLVNQTQPAAPPPQRFERSAPGELLQTDGKEVVLTTDTTVHIISLLDDHSRLCCAAVVSKSLDSASAIAAFDSAVGEYGLPYSVLADRGMCFTGKATNSVGPFERHLWAYGVVTINGRPYHPQTQGKVERYHRTLGEWLEDHGPFSSIEELQRCVDTFRYDYNHLRPHQGIGDITPAERFEMSRWKGADPHGTVDRRVRATLRKVRPHGNISYGDWVIGLGVAWAGHTVRVVDYGHVIELRDDLDEVIRKIEPDYERQYYGTGKRRGRAPVRRTP